MVVSALEPLLARTLVGLGLQLAYFEYVNNGRMLRVFIDKVLENEGQASVTIADCEAASRQLQHVLEVEGVRYDRLEVSSPGLDRKLKSAADFARFSGRDAQVRLRHPVGGRRNFTGVVREVSGDRVALDYDGGRLTFEIADLERARLVPKL